MCLATKAYLIGRSLCNTLHRPLKVHTIESERLFDIKYSLILCKQNRNPTSPYILFKLIIVFFLVEEERDQLNGMGNVCA